MKLTQCASAVLILASLSARDVSGADSPTLCINLRSAAAIPAETIGAARAQMDRIYANAGFEIVWSDDDGPRGGCIVLMMEAEADVATSSAAVMGLALRRGRTRTAHIFFLRVADLAQKHHMTLSRLLGHVMAHEIGHLLLPVDSHSSTGLMRGSWGIAQIRDARDGKLAFTETETRLMVRRLAEHKSLFQLAHQP